MLPHLWITCHATSCIAGAAPLVRHSVPEQAPSGSHSPPQLLHITRRLLSVIEVDPSLADPSHDPLRGPASQGTSYSPLPKVRTRHVLHPARTYLSNLAYLRCDVCVDHPRARSSPRRDFDQSRKPSPSSSLGRPGKSSLETISLQHQHRAAHGDAGVDVERLETAGEACGRDFYPTYTSTDAQRRSHSTLASRDEARPPPPRSASVPLGLYVST